MKTKETILAKLNTSPDRLTELVEQDGIMAQLSRQKFDVFIMN